MIRPAPPRLRGLPLLGNALAFRKDPVALVRRGYEALGPVFALRLGPKPVAVLLGPDNQRAFFEQTDRALSLPEVYRFIIPMFGKVLQAAEPGQYREHRAVLQPSFRAARRGHHLEVMGEVVGAWLGGLGAGGSFELGEAFDRVALDVACGALMGSAFRACLGGTFRSRFRELAGGMEFVLPPNLPLSRFRRRDRARAELHALVRGVIARRRCGQEAGDDFLQSFLEARGCDGSPLPDGLVTDLVLLTVFAAYETTAAQAAWALILLLRHPEHLAAVRAELDAVLPPGGPPDGPAVRRLDRLERALKEAERLCPVTTLLMRHTAAPFDVGGYHVPRGWVAMICPPVSHRMPEVFRHPDVFDPDRFAPDRAEDRAHPCGLATFGGGTHTCPGMPFARDEMKLLLGLLLRRYDLELEDPDPRPDYTTGLTRPRSPCTVRYRER